MKIFESGCTLWYDPPQFILELNLVCEQLFIERTKVVEQSGLKNLIFGKKVDVGNKRAYEFEETRY